MDLHNHECFSRYSFVSDETHKNLRWLDHRIWRGNILNPNRSYDGHLSWTQVLDEYIGVYGTIETLGNWGNPPRAVYCVGNSHYSHGNGGLDHHLTVSLQRIWTCKFRLGGEDVITILRTVGSGERFEFWGPSGYVSGLGLARERIIRLAHPYLPVAKGLGHPIVGPDASKLSMSAVAKTYLERQPSASTPSTVGASSSSTLGAQPSYLNPIVPVAPMQRQSVVIDLCDSSSDDEDEDLPPPASRSSPLSSAATFEDTDLTIPDLAADSDDKVDQGNEPGATALVKKTLTSCPYCDFEGRTYNAWLAAFDIARHREAAEKLRAEAIKPPKPAI
ncbi:hypothetical protein HII31_10849 [Pseudocercospora fuligena]|uniref:Uncharacterized protein n=1 Tax=Pseudocercospora fuligena TaxID=685502 RepID=A0A8H6VH64_9PEZI|nr:hypothetical protein HII31_10849 [Pseudocercospora fuligena]